MRIAALILLSIAPVAIAQRGGSHAGSRRAPAPYVSHSHASGVVVVPYPVFYGGYYAAPYAPDPAGYAPGVVPGYDQSYAPGYDTGYAPGSDTGGQPPVVIMNQNYTPEVANPTLRDYSNTPLPPPGVVQYPPQPQPPDDQPTVYLIAMKDHTIFPAVAYWVEGDVLNYVTAQGTSVNRVSLGLVDRDFSQQLNDQRSVPFKLPAPRN